jgi:glycosyltransferase involved in cell wall biosynthesis
MLSTRQEVLISVVMASYNKEHFVQQSIESILCQTFIDFELIIVDDSSNDGTVSLLRDYSEKDSRIILIENDVNRGANFCRNVGISNARGNYLVFIDADDLLSKNCLQNRYNQAIKFPQLNLLIFTMGVFYKKVGDDKRVWRPISKNPLLDFIQHKLPWSILQPMWKKEFILDLGGFDVLFNRLQDVEINTRALLCKHVRFGQFDIVPDCYYRISEERKNFDDFNFMKRWVSSAIQYINKFKELVKTEDRIFLLGTIFHTMLQLIFFRRSKKISTNEFNDLYAQLNACIIVQELSSLKRMILVFSKWYNLKFIRLPGLNRLILMSLLKLKI